MVLHRRYKLNLMNTDTTIRTELLVGDIGSIVYLHGMLYAKEHNYNHAFEAYVAEALGQFAKRSKPRERIWVIEQNQQVLGSIALCEVSNDIAQLRWFLISPELRGQGMGINLMTSLIRFSLDKNYKTISLWTVQGLDAAKRIYERFGFSLAREIKHQVWGGMHTEQEYTLDLDDSDANV